MGHGDTTEPYVCYCHLPPLIALPAKVIQVKYDGKFTIEYTMSSGEVSAFRVLPAMAKKMMYEHNLCLRLKELMDNEDGQDEIQGLLFALAERE